MPSRPFKGGRYYSEAESFWCECGRFIVPLSSEASDHGDIYRRAAARLMQHKVALAIICASLSHTDYAETINEAQARGLAPKAV